MFDDPNAQRDANRLAQRRRRARLRERELGLAAKDSGVTIPPEALKIECHYDVLELLYSAAALALTDVDCGPNAIARTLIQVAGAAAKVLDGAAFERQKTDDTINSKEYRITIPMTGVYKCVSCATPIHFGEPTKDVSASPPSTPKARPPT